MNKTRVWCDITYTKEIIIETPDDMPTEEVQKLIDAKAEEVLDSFPNPEGWYWASENVETESA